MVLKQLIFLLKLRVNYLIFRNFLLNVMHRRRPNRFNSNSKILLLSLIRSNNRLKIFGFNHKINKVIILNSSKHSNLPNINLWTPEHLTAEWVGRAAE